MTAVVAQLVFVVALVFISAGSLHWLWGWVYLGVSVALLAVNALVLPREVIAERGRSRQNVKGWDKTLTKLSIIPALAGLIVPGLDERFGWAPELPLGVHLAGVALLMLSQGLFTWSMASNRFFSTGVEVQTERGHTLASGGPYRFVRHPGYVGFIGMGLAGPLVLGSVWALIPAAISGAMFVLRTALEDQTLQEQLEGYKGYAQRVRYRLLPGVW
jgi:protein-S-isoprenylcysteine O-methyltransferase Ste14